MDYAPLPTRYEYASLGSCQGATLTRAVFAASGCAIMLLFANGCYTVFQASDVDEGRQLTNLQEWELLAHFTYAQLIKCGLCDAAALDAWKANEKERVEAERREARYYMYTRLKQEFEEGRSQEDIQPLID